MADPLVLPEPIGPQIEALLSPARRKILRWGRRTGKTRTAFIAAIAGHGPGEDGNRALPGILQGVDVVWLAQDYPNLLRVAWKEEVEPRMKHLPYCTLNQQDHTAKIHGLGTLHFASAEAIHGIRGMGSRVGGVIVDEAAWLDLETGLQDVLLPILLDNNGWLILMSTTNAGPDGNNVKRVPSYFNLLCGQVDRGERSEEWASFYATAHQNPVISPAGLQELIDEYPEGSPKLQQEVYADLLEAGEGLALPNLDRKVHMVEPFKIPSHWYQWGAFDWGFNHPWCFGWYACNEDGTVYKVDSLTGRGDQIEDIGAKVRDRVPVHMLKAIHAGRDIFTRKGMAIGFQGPKISERLNAFGWNLIPAAAAPGDRIAGLDNLRAYTHYVKGENGQLVRPPKFMLMDTPGNRQCFSVLAQMQVDPKKLEDALKVDADHAGRGGDDMYDETRYGLMARPWKAKKPSTGTTHDKIPNVAMKVQFGPEGLAVPVRGARRLEDLAEQLSDRSAQNKNRSLGPSGVARW